MRKIFSQDIESQYKLVKMFLAEPEKFVEVINKINYHIASIPKELKKNLRKEISQHKCNPNNINHDY